MILILHVNTNPKINYNLATKLVFLWLQRHGFNWIITSFFLEAQPPMLIIGNNKSIYLVVFPSRLFICMSTTNCFKLEPHITIPLRLRKIGEKNRLCWFSTNIDEFLLIFVSIQFILTFWLNASLEFQSNAIIQMITWNLKNFFQFCSEMIAIWV